VTKNINVVKMPEGITDGNGKPLKEVHVKAMTGADFGKLVMLTEQPEYKANAKLLTCAMSSFHSDGERVWPDVLDAMQLPWNLFKHNKFHDIAAKVNGLEDDAGEKKPKAKAE